MSDSTPGRSRCDGQMGDGRTCMVPARAFFVDSDDSMHRLCIDHALRWCKDIKQFKRALGVETRL